MNPAELIDTQLSPRRSAKQAGREPEIRVADEEEYARPGRPVVGETNIRITKADEDAGIRKARELQIAMTNGSLDGLSKGARKRIMKLKADDMTQMFALTHAMTLSEQANSQDKERASGQNYGKKGRSKYCSRCISKDDTWRGIWQSMNEAGRFCSWSFVI